MILFRSHRTLRRKVTYLKKICFIISRNNVLHEYYLGNIKLQYTVLLWSLLISKFYNWSSPISNSLQQKLLIKMSTNCPYGSSMKQISLWKENFDLVSFCFLCFQICLSLHFYYYLKNILIMYFNKISKK